MSFIRRLLGLERHTQQIVTDWKEYTPVISDGPVDASGNINGAFSTSVVYKKWLWRRTGDEMECRFEYQHTTDSSAANGSGRYYIQLPTGYTIDYDKLPGSANTSGVGSHVGYGVISNDGDDGISFYTQPAFPTVYQTTPRNLIAVNNSDVYADRLDGEYIPNGWHSGWWGLDTAGIQVSLYWKVPIVGWTHKLRG